MDLKLLGRFTREDERLVLSIPEKNVLHLISTECNFNEFCQRFLAGILEDIFSPFLSEFMFGKKISNLKYETFILQDRVQVEENQVTAEYRTFTCFFKFENNPSPLQLFTSIVHNTDVYFDAHVIQQLTQSDPETLGLI